MLNVFIGVIILLVIAYAAMIAMLYSRQRTLIYHPLKPILAPEAYGLTTFTEYRATTPDNESIQLWHHAASPGFPTIVHYHGNATNMGTRTHIYSALAARGFGVLAVGYRGYGSSTGTPSETGLYNDARTGLSFAMQQLHIPIRNIVIYGESLGTGVAVQIATEFDIAALILQSPYTSVAARAAEIYYYAPVMFLIKDSYNSLSKIAHVRAPLLLFHGHKDATIPLAHAKTLFDTATTQKQAVYFAEIGHNDFDTTVISEHVLNFCRTHNLIQS